MGTSFRKGWELKAYLDVRDGNGGMLGVDGKTSSPAFKGIPFTFNR